jgi:hypothetical protein
MQARMERRWLGRAPRASLRCTQETKTADGSAEPGLVPVSVPLPLVRQYAPRRSAALRGWRVVHRSRRGRGRPVGHERPHRGGLVLPAGSGRRAGARGRGRRLTFLRGNEVAAHRAPEADRPAAGRVGAVVMHSTRSPARCHSGPPAPCARTASPDGGRHWRCDERPPPLPSRRGRASRYPVDCRGSTVGSTSDAPRRRTPRGRAADTVTADWSAMLRVTWSRPASAATVAARGARDPRLVAVPGDRGDR